MKKYLKNHHTSQDIWRVNMLDYSIKMIFVYILLHVCTVKLFMNQYTICILYEWQNIRNTLLKINSYLLRNTSIMLIHQNLAKVTIDRPKFIQYCSFSNKWPQCLLNFETFKCDAYWRVALTRGRRLFQS